jgi:hypothetical protein
MTLMNFLFVAKLFGDLGYKELNWNLGPMVTKSGMGSGLISNTENQSYSRKSTHGIRYPSINENAIGL